jgi:hypothetical protein
MNQSRLGPRKWAFVVVAGGALLALPFTQRTRTVLPVSSAEADILASLEPLIVPVGPVPGTVSATNTNAAPADDRLAGDGQATASASQLRELPAWAQAHQSPFDELMAQKAKVPQVEPPEVLPLQPQRPWITPPPKRETGLALPATEVASAGQSVMNDSKLHQSKLAVTSHPAAASPWAEDSTDPVAPQPQQLATDQRTQRKANLSVDAWPDELFTGSPPPQLAARKELQSAIVPADQVMQPLQRRELASVASPPSITRQPTLRSVTAPKVRFGEPTQPMTALPEARRGHVLFQPKN